MRGVFSSLVASSLLIHAATGCCWHHPHEASCDEGAARSLAGADCDDHDADRAASGHSHHSEQGPGNGHSNCRATCHYLPAQKTQLDQLSPTAGLELAAIISATSEIEIAAILQTEQSLDAPAPPPLRRHLFHQILLI